MDQLCGPNYREEEVGALGEDAHRDRQRGRGKSESRWRSGSERHKSDMGREWQRGASSPFERRQSTEMNEPNCFRPRRTCSP